MHCTQKTRKQVTTFMTNHQKHPNPKVRRERERETQRKDSSFFFFCEGKKEPYGGAAPGARQFSGRRNGACRLLSLITCQRTLHREEREREREREQQFKHDNYGVYSVSAVKELYGC